jgi:hypothetical protein
MTRLWEPTIRIGARTERLTTDHADRDASGGLVTIRLGTKYSNKRGVKTCMKNRQ